MIKIGPSTNVISDRIVDLINGQLELMRAQHNVKPLQLLAGQLLGLMATFRTMPPIALHPGTLIELQDSVRECLNSMISSEAKPLAGRDPSAEKRVGRE